MLKALKALALVLVATLGIGVSALVGALIMASMVILKFAIAGAAVILVIFLLVKEWLEYLKTNR